MNLNGWCFWPLGTSKQTKNSVPRPGLTMSTTVIAYFLYGKFAQTNNNYLFLCIKTQQ